MSKKCKILSPYVKDAIPIGLYQPEKYIHKGSVSSSFTDRWTPAQQALLDPLSPKPAILVVGITLKFFPHGTYFSWEAES